MSDMMTPTTTKKRWGKTRCIGHGPTYEIYHASIEAGGFSSQHCHHTKFNSFYVLSGRMLVHFYRGRGGPLRGSQILEAGQTIVAVPEEWHGFEAVTNVELIEWYWCDAIDPSDIERYDEGGLHAPPAGKETPACPSQPSPENT